ncbi:PREDICTED: mismatch repair endonuclease pms1 isoform X2 [Papilio xuthus]|uniref:Mismatch repair endonuclease pms1 isoform X2 n=1 Tax=Papilio xuthus TaxID=66420 RepID=A0AAJ6ZGV2_PAPXU|nr:PREDICTED: mismatch repair endonuclease pms1 isoform X2 [Papilio xuthus]
MADECNTKDTQVAIKPINKDTVHKICSGQVVLSLAVAVKELVENSLDAGATKIDIRLKNHGVYLIEVSDNGTGVTEDNFSALTLKYHTSKLTDYSDLLGVSSFGFRGEALSSLCALAKLTITTRHQSADYATKIEYDHKGHIINKTPCSRQIGTTVTLTDLFSSLPVRQKELQKNSKREFNKMTSLLYAYCLISLGVNITCNNQSNSNTKSLVVTTQGSISYKDNIAAVFGVKQLDNLLDIKTEYAPNIKENIFKGLSGEVKISEESINVEDTEIDLSEDSNDAENNEISNTQDSIQSSQKSQGYKNCAPPVELVGYISTCAHGCGRSSADRQFYYVNSRPCEPTKIMKLINEIYRQFNPHQYPFVFLNIVLERTLVDVNVTPDKRKLFLAKEKAILDVVKCSISKLFENIPRVVKLETAHSINNTQIVPDMEQSRIFNSFMQQFSNKSTKSDIKTNGNTEKKPELKRKSNTLLDYAISKSKRVEINQNSEDDMKLCDETEFNVTEDENINDHTSTSNTIVKKEPANDVDEESSDIPAENEKPEVMYLEFSNELPNTQIRNISDVVIEKSKTIFCKNTNTPVKPILALTPKSKKQEVVTDKEELGKYNRKSIMLKTSIDHVAKLAEIYNNQKQKIKPDKIKFKSEINPVHNKKCEEELSREISKDSFKDMIVIGQFNLGFIITKLGEDLFIIDQHATDEIYNFETLQKTTELTSQKLVIPQQLELSGVNEEILMDNLQIFKKNGFTFEIDENALPTKRVKLLTIPMSKKWIFGKDDIEELLFMLRENDSEYCRPSRVRAMFASRACRKSVMIGTALSKADMKVLVDHMADIDKPWPVYYCFPELSAWQTNNSPSC